MKKLFISLLIGVMVGGCFVGCGEKDDKLTPPTPSNQKIEDVLGKKDKEDKEDKDEKEDKEDKKDKKDRDEEEEDEEEEKQTYKYTQDKALRTAEKVLNSYKFDYYEVDFEDDLEDFGYDEEALVIYIQEDGAPVDGIIEDYMETGFRDFDMDEFEELVGLDEIKSTCKKLSKEIIGEIEDTYGETIDVIITYANEEGTPLYMVSDKGEEFYSICDYVEMCISDYYSEYGDDTYDDDFIDDEYYDDMDYEILEPAAQYLLDYYLGDGSVTYNKGSNKLVCRVTFSKLEMENDFGIVDCTTEDFEEFMIEEGLADEAFEFAEMAQEDVRNEFDPRLEVIVEIYYSSDLVLRVDGNGGVSGL